MNELQRLLCSNAAFTPALRIVEAIPDELRSAPVWSSALHRRGAVACDLLARQLPSLGAGRAVSVSEFRRGGLAKRARRSLAHRCDFSHVACSEGILMPRTRRRPDERT